jgi:hypothetical protein
VVFHLHDLTGGFMAAVEYIVTLAISGVFLLFVLVSKFGLGQGCILADKFCT